MNLETLRIFLKVAKEGNLSQVADQIHISQSAVSQQMKCMEQLLGAKLLERSHKGVTLTAVGKIAQKHSLAITEAYRKMLQEINEEQNLYRTLHIISTPSVSAYALPCTLHQLHKTHPACTLKIESLISDQAEEKIAQGFGDIAIIVGKPKNKNLIGTKVFSNTIHLVASDDFSVPNTITLQDLPNYPILLPPQTQKNRQILDVYLKKIGLNLNNSNILSHLDSIESIKTSAVQGYGLTFLPYMVIKKELYHKQLRIIQLEDFHFQNHYYVVKKAENSYIENGISRMITHLEKILNSTIC